MMHCVYTHIHIRIHDWKIVAAPNTHTNTHTNTCIYQIELDFNENIQELPFKNSVTEWTRERKKERERA